MSMGRDHIGNTPQKNPAIGEDLFQTVSTRSGGLLLDKSRQYERDSISLGVNQASSETESFFLLLLFIHVDVTVGDIKNPRVTFLSLPSGRECEKNSTR